jgi:hypothetical protein
MGTLHHPQRRVKRQPLQPGQRVRVIWSGKLGTVIQTGHPNHEKGQRRRCAVVKLDPFYIPAMTGHQHPTPVEGIYLQRDLEVVEVASE